MTDEAFGRHQRTPAEIQRELEAEREGRPFLLYRDGEGRAQIHPLDPAAGPLVLGRGDGAGIDIDWDHEVSRVHAQLEPIGGDWAIVDDGLSRNGTFVNGERVAGRRRLRDGDTIHLGTTVRVGFRQPIAGGARETLAAPARAVGRISEAQRRVLVALCRPYREGGAFAAPATNQQIAAELVLSIDAIKTHMRALYSRFGVEDLQPQQKRVRLVELAFASGEVTPRDLE